MIQPIFAASCDTALEGVHSWFMMFPLHLFIGHDFAADTDARWSNNALQETFSVSWCFGQGYKYGNEMIDICLSHHSKYQAIF